MVFLGCEHSGYTGNAMGRCVHTMDTTSQDQLWEEASGSGGGDSAVAYEPSSASPSAAHGGSQQRAEGQLQEGGRKDCSHSRSSLGEERRWDGRKPSLGIPLGLPVARSINCPRHTHIPLLSPKTIPATWAPRSSWSWQLLNALYFESTPSKYKTASVSVILKCAGRASRLCDWEDKDDKYQLQFWTAVMCQERQ